MPKALVTGATGLLGRAILQSFQDAGWDVVGTGLSRSGPGIVKLDILDPEAVRALVEKEKPNIIIHSAAERSPDAVAADPAKAKSLNVDATAALTTLASSHSIPLLYMSTDYVFPGVPGEAPYAESAPPRATNLYGQLKLDGEHSMLQAAKESKGVRLGAVLRVPVLYGRVDPDIGNKESAVNVLVDKVRDCAGGKKVVMDDWARRFPTNVADIGNCIVKIGERWTQALRGESADGKGVQVPAIMQFSGRECFTKYQMCEIFAEILGLDIGGMERDKSGGAGDGVQRPFDTQLATQELEGFLGGAKLETVGFKEWWARDLGESTK